MTVLTIDALLRQAAERAGEHDAVIDRGRRITYAELDRQSNRLARVLRARGVRPGDRVGLYLEKSLEAIVGVYGTLKAGATYVPLDDQAPVRRVAYIARDAGIRGLITSAHQAPQWTELAAEAASLEWAIVAGEVTGPAAGIELIPWSALEELDTAPLERHEDPDALAYVLYTSGSTGEPKGVMLSHRNGLGFIDWAAREIGVSARDRLSSHAPLHFDLSTFDLFAAAWGAAPVVLVPRETSVFPIELARFIREARITVWYSVPSILTQLVLRGDLDKHPLPDLRAVIFAGEVFPGKYLSRLMELVPAPRYVNFYGPTETNVCTWYEVPHEEPLGESLPIGWPIPGVQAIVERGDGTPAAPGEMGELLIRGTTVMHGYWGDPERTARTLSEGEGERIYRTGDLVREEPDGRLIFLGRRDAQIKTRGYRVELGEIEAALNALGVVLECAVVAVPDEAITNRLKAFVVTREPISPSALAAVCGDRLPRYMIPDQFEFLDTLPKSSTGKIDRRQLQQGEGGMAGHVGR